MSDVIIAALISLVGIILSAVVTRNNLYHELDKKDAVFQEKLEQIDEHFREVNHRLEIHNGYAKIFSENIPVVQEKLKVCEARIKDLEINERERKHENK